MCVHTRPDCAGPLPFVTLVLSRDDDWYASLLRYGGTDRAEQHPAESTPAVTTHDDELGLLSLFEKMADGSLKLDNALDRDLRIAFLPAGQMSRSKNQHCAQRVMRPIDHHDVLL